MTSGARRKSRRTSTTGKVRPSGDILTEYKAPGNPLAGQVNNEGGSSSRLNTYADALRESLGPAYLLHPEEYNSILNRANELGVSVEFRPGTLAYDMEFGRPGKKIMKHVRLLLMKCVKEDWKS